MSHESVRDVRDVRDKPFSCTHEAVIQDGPESKGVDRKAEGSDRTSRTSRTDASPLASMLALFPVVAECPPPPVANCQPPARLAAPMWNADQAAAVVAECMLVIDQGLAALTPAQQNVALIYRSLCGRYSVEGDLLLWEMPNFLRQELARWGASACRAGVGLPTAEQNDKGDH